MIRLTDEIKYRVTERNYQMHVKTPDPRNFDFFFAVFFLLFVTFIFCLFFLNFSCSFQHFYFYRYFFRFTSFFQIWKIYKKDVKNE